MKIWLDFYIKSLFILISFHHNVLLGEQNGVYETVSQISTQDDFFYDFVHEFEVCIGIYFKLYLISFFDWVNMIG